MVIIILNILDHRAKKSTGGSAGRSYNDKSVAPSEKYRKGLCCMSNNRAKNMQSKVL